MVLNHVQGPPKPCIIKPWVVYEGSAHGFKTMCNVDIFFADNLIFNFLLFC